MAKKFVRGITDVKTINNQDFDTNNVNDLLSDGQYNYIHRKKGKAEEYHNLTDNIKTISSDNTELLSVTNNNKTTNTATLHPKHDKQKEQVLESTRDTITINHGTNGTAEKTTVDTNPQKVLEHENLKTGDGLTTSFNTDETTIMFKATRKPPETNLNTLGEGVIRGDGFSIDQVPDGYQVNSAAYVTIRVSENRKVQFCIRESGVEDGKIRLYYRFIINGEVTKWQKMPGDSGELNNQLEQKQNKLTAGDGITIQGQTISASAPKSNIEFYHSTGWLFRAFKQVVTNGNLTFVTFTFDCKYESAERVLDGKLKQDLEKFVGAGMTVSNAALTITNDGTNIKLINSAPSENVNQQGTFTFYEETAGGTGGGGDLPPA